MIGIRTVQYCNTQETQPMPDEQREITDDMLLSELTVGEFKALLHELLANVAPQAETPSESKIEVEVNVRRKSLDEFMNDLGESK
jgi:hypothetical protein